MHASQLAALLLAAAAPAVQTETRPLMGSEVRVTVVGGAEDSVRAGTAAAFAVFQRAEAVLNEWRPDSPVSALNAAAGNGAWVALPLDLCRALEASLAGAARTGGLFDPTWAALRHLWRFDPAADGQPPPDAALDAACPLVSHRDLELVAAGDGCRARLARAGMQVGLGGIAKGWAVDRAVEALRRHGLRDFAVQAGGDLYLAGRPGDRPWTVGIRDPRGAPTETFASLEVSDAAFSTSGDYEHAFVRDGVRYHHIIDPRTCRPARASRSASVLAGTATDAEVLTKAAFILGGRAGLELVERSGASAVLVTDDNRVLLSPSLSRRVRWKAPRP